MYTTIELFQLAMLQTSNVPEAYRRMRSAAMLTYDTFETEDSYKERVKIDVLSSMIFVTKDTEQRQHSQNCIVFSAPRDDGTVVFLEPFPNEAGEYKVTVLTMRFEEDTDYIHDSVADGELWLGRGEGVLTVARTSINCRPKQFAQPSLTVMD